MSFIKIKKKSVRQLIILVTSAVHVSIKRIKIIGVISNISYITPFDTTFGALN